MSNGERAIKAAKELQEACEGVAHAVNEIKDEVQIKPDFIFGTSGAAVMPVGSWQVVTDAMDRWTKASEAFLSSLSGSGSGSPSPGPTERGEMGHGQ